MPEENCQSPIVDQKSNRRERYRLSRADRSTASSRSKSVPVKEVGGKGISHWWERPEFAKNFIRCERDPACESCQRLNEHRLHLLKERRKYPPHKFVLSDFAHRFSKLQRREVKLPKTKKDFFHGIQASDVTSHLNKSLPSHYSLDQEAPTEWFGIKSSDVTKVLDASIRCPKPPSRDYFFGVQSTDITQNSRIIPLSPTGRDGDPQEFFGRPRSDITNFDVLPKTIEDKGSVERELNPLGKVRLPFTPAYVNRTLILRANQNLWVCLEDRSRCFVDNTQVAFHV